MHLKDKYIKILNENDFNRAIKFLKDNNINLLEGEYNNFTDAVNYINKSYFLSGEMTLVIHDSDGGAQWANHTGNCEEFILPKETISLREKLLNLFSDIELTIKCNTIQECISYFKLLNNLNLKSAMGNSYIDIHTTTYRTGIKNINDYGSFLHKPGRGMSTTAMYVISGKLVEFKDLLKHINHE